ncbi:hypothetical protein D6777_01165 [Candidatus Woesearchaeota archaeon]|nr:MAG: hypothetical protein D6777_01165 [Candidatus Woesearchaeota archaeon]
MYWYFDSDISDIDMCISAKDNCLWGLLLNSVGKKAKAIKVVESMKKIDLVKDDNLVYWYVKTKGIGGNMIINAECNALWGMLLNAVGYRDRAIQVIELMEEIGLVRPDGLVSSNVETNGSDGDMNVYSYSNALWGLLLNAVGYRDKANQVVESMNYLRSLVRDDELVFHSEIRYSSDKENKIFSEDNALWVLLLNSLGYKNKAKQVIKSMKKLTNLVRSDNLVSDFVKLDGSNNIKYVKSSNNALWGLCLHPEGYKVFTGELS